MISEVNRFRILSALLILPVIIKVIIMYTALYKSYPKLSERNMEIYQTYKRSIRFLNTKFYSDESGHYRVIPVGIQQPFQFTHDVGYVSQCSWNRFHLIEDLLEVWKGSVSIAVFFEPELADDVIWTISKAIHCVNRTDLYFVLVVPARDHYVFNNQESNYLKLTEPGICNSLYKIDHDNARNYDRSTPYPVNFLRNMAKRSAITEYVLVADIDMLPNKDLRKDFLRYARSKKMYSNKLVYVIPTFEMNVTAKMPQTKTEIILETKRGNLRPFYLVPCRKCQLLTNYTKWFSYSNFPGVRELYKVDWKYPWEPFYISHRSVPDYDVRFKQYGFNRVSQICQTYVAGYDFVVLDNAFLIHRGFKTWTDFHDSKDKEMDLNRKLYAEFKEEMKLKYPNSNRRCDTENK